MTPPSIVPHQGLVDPTTRAWDGLMGLALNAAAEALRHQPQTVFGISSHERYPTQLLLVVEVVCYARGIYQSSSVKTFTRTNPELSRLFQSHFPSALLIKRFRRFHRETIKTCLHHVFQLALRVRFGAPDVDEAPIDFCVARAIDQWFEPMCGPRPDAEAEDRIDQAILWDGMDAA